MTRYAVTQAEDKGRIAAYNFLIERRKYPLALRPKNPYEIFSAEEYNAWQENFDFTERKHSK